MMKAALYDYHQLFIQKLAYLFIMMISKNAGMYYLMSILHQIMFILELFIHLAKYMM
jgi:hypothetical protein